MRSLEEYKAEIFRRSEARIEKRKRQRRRVLAVCIPLCLCVGVGALLSKLPLAQKAEDASMPEKADGSFSYFNQNEAAVPAEGTPISPLFRETAEGTVVAPDGTEYIRVGTENEFRILGQSEHLGYIEGEVKSFTHLFSQIQTGMYGVDGDTATLLRYFPDCEFASCYVRSDCLKTQVSLDNCIQFTLGKFDAQPAEITDSQKGIMGNEECSAFLREISGGQTAQDAGLYELVRQPDGFLKNCYVYGYAYGIVQKTLNLVMPLEIISFDDKAYAITIDGTQYVLPESWLTRLMG